MEKTEHLPGLDSLRFFAFLSIYLFHTTETMSLGFLGIPVFFVLSSFLITFLALKEIQNTGNFSRKNFFIRRALRIYPLYFLVIIGSFIILPLLSDQFGMNITLPSEQWKYWLLLSNYEQSDHIYALKFLWSISVEEQFYILFIFLSFYFYSKLHLVIIGLYLLHFSAPILNNLINPYYNPLTYFAEFASGMLAAGLYVNKSKFLRNRILIPVSIIALIFSIISFLNLSVGWLFNFSLSLLIGCIILLVITNLNSYTKQNAVFHSTEYLGKFTYGLYVYSGFFITLGSIVLSEMVTYQKVIVQLCLLLLLSLISYYFFEKKFLDLKKYARS